MKKVILITGVSSGIGKATAKYFVNKGWHMIQNLPKWKATLPFWYG